MYASAEQLTIQSHENYDERTRHHNDTVTWLAETLHGSMRTSFDYHFDGQELYAEDGGSIGEVFAGAIAAAKEIVGLNPNLLFELRRRLIEYDEYQDMLSMAKHELSNTMVVVSDFPEELMTIDENIGGYNTNRRQTMLRVISRLEDGSLRMVTQSLDKSNRQALEAIYQRLGEQPGAGELLGQRLHLDLPEAWHGQLVDNLRQAYDQSLAEQYGGDWHAGIEQTSDNTPLNTAQFVSQQTDLIDWFVDAKLDDSIGAEKLRYGLAATIEKRFNESFETSIQTIYANEYPSFGSNNLYAEITIAEQQAVIKGATYSGCGVTTRALNVGDGQLSEAGYGNRTKADTKYNFDKKMHCVVCQAPPKKGESKKSCGPCGICRSCDRKLGGKG